MQVSLAACSDAWRYREGNHLHRRHPRAMRFRLVLANCSEQGRSLQGHHWILCKFSKLKLKLWNLTIISLILGFRQKVRLPCRRNDLPDHRQGLPLEAPRKRWRQAADAMGEEEQLDASRWDDHDHQAGRNDQDQAHRREDWFRKLGLVDGKLLVIHWNKKF